MEVDLGTIAPNLERFMALLESVPWFTNLGESSLRDSEVDRIHSWDELPGPERGYGSLFGRWLAFVRETIEADEKLRRDELTEVWDRVYALVLELAPRNIPEFDPTEDAWYGPTACAHFAAYTAALIAWHILLGRPLPKLIAEEWRWFAAGHWPCDFADEPVGLDESLQDVPEVRFLVY